MTAEAARPVDKRRAREERRPAAKWVFNNRRAMISLAFFGLMMFVFILANPTVFLQPRIYTSVMVSLPISIFLIVPLVFVVTSGEIDLSFPAITGLSAYGFALAVDNGINPWIGALIALAIGVFLGFCNGMLIVRGNLSSLVATLGMNFFLRGLINIFATGRSIAMPELREDPIKLFFAGNVAGIPTQMILVVIFVIIGWLLFNKHVFGARVQCVGDNPDSSREMGINVNRTRILVFMFVGVGAALAGLTTTLINTVWWPSTGDGLLLPVLAAVFIGGTPTWGGIGTVVGGAIGAAIVAFIESGVISAGLDGYFTQFAYGLIIILSLIGHRFMGARQR
jgi:simple sugar transport system permease protein